MRIKLAVLLFFSIIIQAMHVAGQEDAPSIAQEYLYIIPQEGRYTNLFDFDIAVPARAEKPVVFLVDTAKPDRLTAVINHLRTYGHLWVALSTSVPATHLICSSEANGVPAIFDSWDIARHVIKASGRQSAGLADLYQSLQLKKDFLRAPLEQLDAVVSAWEKEEYSYHYLQFTDLLAETRRGEVPVERYLYSLFQLMDEYEVPTEPYPILTLYRTAYLTDYSQKGVAPYVFEQIQRQQETFHTRLTRLSVQLSPADVDFLLETVVETKMRFADYKRFMALMNTIGIDIKGEYPAFHFRIYTQAWHDKLKTTQVQDEIRRATAALKDTLAPPRERLLLVEWNTYRKALKRFVDGYVTLEEYRIINQSPRFTRQGPLDDVTKRVIRDIEPIWTDTVQKKVSEAVRTFFSYTRLYEDDFKSLNRAVNDTSADTVFVIVQPQEVAAWRFWFSTEPTGGIIRIKIKPDQPEGDNNYFKLMRGERSPFEKLLEGFGGTQ